MFNLFTKTNEIKLLDQRVDKLHNVLSDVNSNCLRLAEQARGIIERQISILNRLDQLEINQELGDD